MFQMANQSGEKSRPFRVAAEYGEWLLKELDELRRPDENFDQLAKRTGMSRVTLWRLKSGDGTVATATRLRDWIASHGGPALPDPAQRLEVDDDPEWVMIGRELKDRWPEEYGQLKQILSKRLAAKVLLDEASEDMAAILRKTTH